MNAKKIMITDENKIHNTGKDSVFLWCLHCERTYRRGECREIEGLQCCPYDDCDGDAVIDGWSWGTVRDEHSEYPLIPEEGKRYPLYNNQAQERK